jgi:hypothetical protein
MSVIINGTTGITSPGGDTSTVSVTTPLVTNAGTLALSATGANIITGSTSGTERLRINAGGDLLVNTTSAVGPLASGFSITAAGQAFNISSPSSTLGNYFHTSYTSGSRFSAGFYLNASLVGNIAHSGSTTFYNTSSDYRLKEDIQPMTGALEKVQALNPVTYTWKVDGSAGQGFIAHELQAVVPDCVTGEKDAVDKDGKPVMQGMDASFLVGILTAAIKEQQAIITSLTARIEALEQA